MNDQWQWLLILIIIIIINGQLVVMKRNDY